MPHPAGPDVDPKAPIAVLHGKEAFLRLDLTRGLRQTLEAEHGEVESCRFDGVRDAIADVLDECRSFGLMTRHKLVVVDEADQLIKGEARQVMERYASGPSGQATLVLRCETWNRGNLDKLIVGCGGVLVACEPLGAQAAAAWAVQRAGGAHGARLDREAARLLVDRVGADLGRLDSELAKLAIGHETIGPERVAELVGATREEEVWSIQAALLSEGPEAVLRRLAMILGNAKGDQTVVVFFAAMDLCRKLHAASEALRQLMNPAEVAKRLRLWGPSQQLVMTTARTIDPAQAAGLLTLAVEADRRSKSGLGKAERILESLALTVSAATRR
jgi:DNA polymerase-3 subunit delta